ncbi:MAG: hypothetical protein QOJ84_3485 [Bradyrhizobium sp.]|jgi:adenylosuccinate lyase|nr:hypothetical protein [Bradyrhizobium sp.]
MNRYSSRNPLRRLHNGTARLARWLSFEIAMLRSSRELRTPDGRRFVELSSLVEGYLVTRLNEKR